jgi:hypothetical protein
MNPFDRNNVSDTAAPTRRAGLPKADARMRWFLDGIAPAGLPSQPISK